MSAVAVIDAAGVVGRHELADAPVLRRPSAPLRSRVAYAAAHVVPRVAAENVPGAPADIDWDATLAFRRHVWSWGLGVADAMDTAQRNMGLDWAACSELILPWPAPLVTASSSLRVRQPTCFASAHSSSRLEPHSTRGSAIFIS